MATPTSTKWATLSVIGLLALGSAACAYDNYGDHRRGDRHGSRGDHRDRDHHGDRDGHRDHDRRGGH